MLALGGVVAGSRSSTGQTSGWSAVGPVPTARESSHAAVQLAGGKVLVAGGFSRNLPTAEADLWDPVSGKWEKAAPMSVARAAETATLLRDGTVLVAGGSTRTRASTQSSLASAELYDPVSGSWAATGSMTEGRSGHTAPMLNDGRVLVAGGIPANPGPKMLASAEVYDPRSRSWRPAGSMSEGRTEFSAGLLEDGKVLAAGGRPAPQGFSLNVAELYDPRSNSWAVVPHLMTAQRASHAAASLRGGKVLITGGTVIRAGPEAPPKPVQATTEVFDPASSSFSPAAPMARARMAHSATSVGGKVLVTGGSASPDEPPQTAEVYDPRAGAWAPTGPPAGPFCAPATCIIGAPAQRAVAIEGEKCGPRCGSVLVVGGGDGTLAQLYSPPEAGAASPPGPASAAPPTPGSPMQGGSELVAPSAQGRGAEPGLAEKDSGRNFRLPLRAASAAAVLALGSGVLFAVRKRRRSS